MLLVWLLYWPACVSVCVCGSAASNSSKQHSGRLKNCSMGITKIDKSASMTHNWHNSHNQCASGLALFAVFICFHEFHLDVMDSKMLLSFQGSQAIKICQWLPLNKAWTGHLQLVTPLICKCNSHAAHRLQAPVHLQAYEIVRININKRYTANCCSLE